jgi:hypothetical protein
MRTGLYNVCYRTGVFEFPGCPRKVADIRVEPTTDR